MYQPLSVGTPRVYSYQNKGGGSLENVLCMLHCTAPEEKVPKKPKHYHSFSICHNTVEIRRGDHKGVRYSRLVLFAESLAGAHCA